MEKNKMEPPKAPENITVFDKCFVQPRIPFHISQLLSDDYIRNSKSPRPPENVERTP